MGLVRGMVVMSVVTGFGVHIFSEYGNHIENAIRDAHSNTITWQLESGFLRYTKCDRNDPQSADRLQFYVFNDDELQQRYNANNEVKSISLDTCLNHNDDLCYGGFTLTRERGEQWSLSVTEDLQQRTNDDNCLTQKVLGDVVAYATDKFRQNVTVPELERLYCNN